MVNKFSSLLPLLAAGGVVAAIHAGADHARVQMPQRSAAGTTLPANGATRSTVLRTRIAGTGGRPVSQAQRRMPAFSTAGTFGFRYLGAFHPGIEGTSAVAIGDVTGDRRNDLVVAIADTTNSTTRVALFEQGLDGQLKQPIRSGNLPRSNNPPLALANLDSDPGLEIVTGGAVNTLTTLDYHPGEFWVSTYSYDAHLGEISNDHLGLIDLNQDSYLDVVSLNYKLADARLGNGRGGFSRTVYLDMPGNGNYQLRIGDVTGDGLEDMVLAALDGERAFWVYPHEGTAFGAPVRYSTIDLENLPSSLALGDFNNDHRLDVALSVHDGDNSNLRIYYQKADGTLDRWVRIPAAVGTLELVTGDFNGDGRADLAEHHGTVSYRLQQTGGLTSPAVVVPTGQSVPKAGAANPMATGDINGDGCVDLVSADTARGAVVYLAENCARPKLRTGGGHQRMPAGG